MSAAPTRLNTVQRAFMRDWLNNCIGSAQAQPPSVRRDQLLATLRKSLERYEDRPQLRLIVGGKR